MFFLANSVIDILSSSGKSGPSQASYDLVNILVPRECCVADSQGRACIQLLPQYSTLSKCLADARFVLGHFFLPFNSGQFCEFSPFSLFPQSGNLRWCHPPSEVNLAGKGMSLS